MQNNFGNIYVSKSTYGLAHSTSPIVNLLPLTNKLPLLLTLTATTVVYDWVKTNQILKNRHYVIGNSILSVFVPMILFISVH